MITPSHMIIVTRGYHDDHAYAMTKTHTGYIYQALCNTLFWETGYYIISLDSMAHGKLLRKVCQEKTA